MNEKALEELAVRTLTEQIMRGVEASAFKAATHATHAALTTAMTGGRFWAVHLRLMLDLVKKYDAAPDDLRLPPGARGDVPATDRVIDAFRQFAEELKAYDALMKETSATLSESADKVGRCTCAICAEGGGA